MEWEGMRDAMVVGEELTAPERLVTPDSTDLTLL